MGEGERGRGGKGREEERKEEEAHLILVWLTLEFGSSLTTAWLTILFALSAYLSVDRLSS